MGAFPTVACQNIFYGKRPVGNFFKLKCFPGTTHNITGLFFIYCLQRLFKMPHLVFKKVQNKILKKVEKH